MNIFPRILLTTDAHKYGILANNLLQGNGFTLSQKPELIFPPGYSILLLPFIKFLDPNTAVLAMMYTSFTLLVLGIFLLTRKLFNLSTAAITALAILLNGNLILGMLNGFAEVSMFGFLFFSFLFLTQKSKSSYLLSGMFAAIAYLIKPESILYLSIFLTTGIASKKIKLTHLLFLLLPISLAMAGYTMFLYLNTGKVALSGKIATLEWDQYIEDKSISRESIMYRINNDYTLGPNLTNFDLKNINLSKRFIVNYKDLKQAIFELILPFKLVLITVLLSFIAISGLRKKIMSLVLLNIPTGLIMMFHIEKRYLWGWLFGVIVILAATIIKATEKNQAVFYRIIGALALIALIQLTFYAYFPLKKELPELIKQQQEIDAFLASNKIAEPTILARKPVYSFLTRKDYYPLPYANTTPDLSMFLDKFTGTAIVLDRWSYWTMSYVHQSVYDDSLSANRSIAENKNVVLLKDWGN